MLTNKWIIVALGAAVTMLGYFGTVDWTTLEPTKAGAIISAIGVLKIFIGAIMPPAGQSTITATGGSILTHTCFAILGLMFVALVAPSFIGVSPALAGASNIDEIAGGAPRLFVGSIILWALVTLVVLALAKLVQWGARRALALVAVGLAAVSLAACAVDSVTGQYEIAGHDIGITPAQVAIADSDVKAFVAALPSVCAKAAGGQTILAADLAIIQTKSKLPAKTVANIGNATQIIVQVCAGIAANLPPAQ